MGKGGDNSSNDIEIFLIVLILALIGISLLFNYYVEYFYALWKYVRYAEIYAFSWMEYLIPGKWKPEFSQILDFLGSTSHNELTSKTVNMVDGHIRYYIGPIMGLIVFYIGTKMESGNTSITKVHNINSLLADRSKVYPHLQDYVNYDPNKEFVEYRHGNEHSMTHAAPLTTGMFCRMRPAPGLEVKSQTRPDLRYPIWDGKKKFDIDIAKEALESQLGPTFRRLGEIEGEYKIAFDYISSKIKISRDEIYQLAIMLANKIKSEQPLSDAEGSIQSLISTEQKGKKKKSHKPISLELNQNSVRQFYERAMADTTLHTAIRLLKSEQIMFRHAFLSTGLVTLMKEASSRDNFSLNVIRNRLKAKNRPLYYALNSVGRAGSHIESSGISTHHAFEKDCGQPVSIPHIELAIVGIQEELNLD